MCLCVCLSTGISPEPHARSLLPVFVHVAYGRGSVLLRQGDEIPKRMGFCGFFFPIDNALYCIAIGIHTKTAKPIEMPFGIMSRLGARNGVTWG